MSQQSDTDTEGTARGRRRERPAAAVVRGASDKVASGAIARAVERKAAEIDVRRIPRQARGAATFNAILDATGRLLDEAGPEVVTTNLVAEVAGVNIATLYQYFPSKESILLALFQRDTAFRMQRADDMLAGLGETDDWRQRIGELVDEVVRLRRTQPGAGSLRRAMRASPELRVYERDSMVNGARSLGAELVKRGHADAARGEVAALCILEIATALLDLRAIGYAGGMGHQDDRIIAEYKALITGYFAEFLDP